MNKKMSATVMVMVVVSLLGFCIENIWIAATQGVINNRNMLLPFLWGYGLAILAIYLLFGTPNEPKLFTHGLSLSSEAAKTSYYFLISFLCVCVGEIILGYTIELGCDIIWWDYTPLPLHITRYTSVPTSAAFATLITVFMKHFFLPMRGAFERINSNVLMWISVFFVIILSLDMVNSLIYMINNHDTMHVWSVTLGGGIRGAMENK